MTRVVLSGAGFCDRAKTMSTPLAISEEGELRSAVFCTYHFRVKLSG